MNNFIQPVFLSFCFHKVVPNTATNAARVADAVPCKQGVKNGDRVLAIGDYKV